MYVKKCEAKLNVGLSNFSTCACMIARTRQTIQSCGYLVCHCAELYAMAKLAARYIIEGIVFARLPLNPSAID